MKIFLSGKIGNNFYIMVNVLKGISFEKKFKINCIIVQQHAMNNIQFYLPKIIFKPFRCIKCITTSSAIKFDVMQAQQKFGFGKCKVACSKDKWPKESTQEESGKRNYIPAKSQFLKAKVAFL